MDCLRVPREITLAGVRAKRASWSAGMCRDVIIPNPSVKPVRAFLDTANPYDKGEEPGSLWYMRESTHRFIRTKALQEHSCLLYPKGDAIMPLNPRAFVDQHLTDGDILISKDSNVGECAMVNGDCCKTCMFSGGVVRLNPAADRYYLFSFLKHPIFRMQLIAKAARGATITHAKTLWLDCKVPLPNQTDASLVQRYVAALMRSIVEKEKAILDCSERIHAQISGELTANQNPATFAFAYPSLADLRMLGRMDACIYDREYKSTIWLIENYTHGCITPSQAGFTVTPGPSLEMKLLRTRLNSDSAKPGFYALILPTNISVYGTMNAVPYLGTAKKLPLLKQGDIVFGEAGFHKGRSIVLLDGIDNCTTNAHGLYARRADGNVAESVFFRCVFNWYRSMRLIDLMAVGGSGGHFSPEYFHYLRIPRFPDAVKERVVKAYHSAGAPPVDELTLDNFVDWHSRWNASLGIWELDREIKNLQKTLLEVQGQIIEGKAVAVPFADGKE